MDKHPIIDLQLGEDLPSHIINDVPSITSVSDWIGLAYDQVTSKFPNNASARQLPPEISIRIVSITESRSLNKQFRGKDKPTNVLSFESELPEFVPSGFLGDLAICAEVVVAEAKEQNKAIQSHWAHMSIHGLLHLMGFDHIDKSDAMEMEALEIDILAKLGIDDPYQIS